MTRQTTRRRVGFRGSQIIDQEVKEIYDEIFALDTVEKQQAALCSWWDYLKSTCTKESPCIECRREMEASGG